MPAFLVELLQRYYRNPRRIEEKVINDFIMTSYLSLGYLKMFYQCGLLTIGSYDERFHLYTLDYPNEEAKYYYHVCLPQQGETPSV